MRCTNVFILIAVISSLVLSIATYLWFPIFEFKGFEKALDGIVLLSSISLGFYGACLSVLASIFNTKIVKEVMSDNNYRKEFIIVASSSLVIGFLLVITTIFYQVLYENSTVPFFIMNLINSIWLFLLIIFLAMSVLFILVSFLIFFQNKNVEQEVNPGEITNPDF